MIYVNKANAVAKVPQIERALAYIREHGKAAADGKVELDGKDLYIAFQSYDTKERADCKYEAHQNYLDVQYVIEGEEVMIVTDKEGLSEKVRYNAEKDVVFYNDDKAGEAYTLKAGDYIVVYPDDVHMPKVRSQKIGRVKKAVVKIRL